MEQITGRIAGNAQVKKTKGGKELVSFSVAVNRRYKTKDGQIEKVATFYQCAYWRNTTIAPYLKQGMIVTVFGHIGVNAYQKRDGDFVANLVCHVNTVEFITGAKEHMETTTNATAPVADGTQTTDLPF